MDSIPEGIALIFVNTSYQTVASPPKNILLPQKKLVAVVVKI